MENTLCNNDEIREEERVRMSKNTIIISSESLSSDDSLETLSVESSGSGRRQITTKPVRSSNKSSTFTAEHNSDNEGTPLGKTHQGPFTSKQQTLEKSSGYISSVASWILNIY